MSNTKQILKDAIADAKAVRETALTQAKLALEEAFTPFLREKLTQKLSEMEDETAYESNEEVYEDDYAEDDAKTMPYQIIQKNDVLLSVLFGQFYKTINDRWHFDQSVIDFIFKVRVIFAHHHAYGQISSTVFKCRKCI